jgi:hypothetical protein
MKKVNGIFEVDVSFTTDGRVMVTQAQRVDSARNHGTICVQRWKDKDILVPQILEPRDTLGVHSACIPRCLCKTYRGSLLQALKSLM